ncbi:hypothetical protein SmJEL517_g02374 [Synchytrium microbalum]|uniref:SH3 domain-containing protein n=1 Tax=Synchytrium microbalum TaxID=1806994 RepID=A0A507C0K0_9FUNG|nr:uncharacterized protein SmJEL517_g02374 [Synchytrium microbalum]TPX35060.1 hypothetical protein SmJEL517_g02374 [Synchytrium microbalum]
MDALKRKLGLLFRSHKQHPHLVTKDAKVSTLSIASGPDLVDDSTMIEELSISADQTVAGRIYSGGSHAKTTGVASKVGDSRPPSDSDIAESFIQYRVNAAYVPCEPEELELNVGDLITVTAEFVDGWSRGFSHASGEYGLVPLVALEELVQQLDWSVLTPTLTRTNSATSHDDLSDLQIWLNPPDFSSTILALKQKRHSSTRGWLLDELMDWTNSYRESRVYWLSGVAGVGKSVISGCFADELRQRDQLAAHFFCKHDELARNDPFNVIAAWAYQIAAFDSDVRQALRDLHQAEPNFLINTPSVGLQFQQLIAEPLSKYRGEKAVILIDALDECAVDGSRSRKEFLQTLGRYFASLPQNIAMFVTSRPLQDLRKQLSGYTPRMMELGDTYNLNDIKVYALYRMTRRRRIMGSDEAVILLADKLSVMAHGLFVWLCLACDQMDKSDNPTQTISELGQRTLGNYEDWMGTVYTRALVSSFRGADDTAMKLYTVLVGAIVALRTPLSLEDISALADIPLTRVKLNLTRLESLLVISNSSVQLMHKSVADFISSPDRCIGDASPFYIDRRLAEAHLAKVCLLALPANLRLESIQGQIELLRGIVPSGTSGHLSYSFAHWGDHLDSLLELDVELTDILTQTLQHYDRAMLIVAVLKNLPLALKHILQVGGGATLLKSAEEIHFFKSAILFEAAASDNPEICDVLLEYGGADVDCLNQTRQTPLYVCSFAHTRPDVVRVLLRHGANTYFMTPTGMPIDAVATGSATREIENERIRRKVKLDESHMDEAMNAARLADLSSLNHLITSNPNMNINRQYPECSSKTLLLVACQYGSLKVVAYLLSKGADPNIADVLNLSPLHHACVCGSLPIVQALVEAGAKVDAEGRERRSAFFSNAFVRPIDLACEKGHVDIIKWLLDIGVSPSALEHGKIHPLLYAAIGNSVDVCELLLGKGVDINYQSRYLGTAIFAAAIFGAETVTQYLIGVGADAELGWNAPGLETEALRSPSVSPLMASGIKGYQNIFALLLPKSGPGEKRVHMEIRHRDSWFVVDYTPFSLAAMANEPELVRLMLEYGADVDAATIPSTSTLLRGETTPLLTAGYYGRINIARMLLEAGANIHARGPNGRSCLHMVAVSSIIGERGKSDMVRLLRFYKANLDDVDHDGNTAVHLAIVMKATQMVDTLVELGARIDIANNLGNTCLHEAVRQRAAGMVKLLTEKGADKFVENKEGLTPSQIAVKEGYNELVQLFKRRSSMD